VISQDLTAKVDAFIASPEIVIVALDACSKVLAKAVIDQVQQCKPSRLHILTASPSLNNEDLEGIVRGISGDKFELPKLDIYPCPVEEFKSTKYFHSVLSTLSYSGRAIAITHVDAITTDCWAQRLAADYFSLAAFQNPSSFAISALGLKHPVNKVSSEAISDGGLPAPAVDQWLNEYAESEAYDTVVLSASASFICGDLPVGFLASCTSDGELYQQLAALGPIQLSSHVFVDDRPLSESLLSAAHVLRAELCAQRVNHPINRFSHALAELIVREEEPPKAITSKAVQLHIAHSWGGGLGRWVQDFIEADEQNRNLVLRPIGVRGAFAQSLALYRSGEMDVPLQQWVLADSIASTAVFHAQYAQILESIIEDYGVEKIALSSLIGQSLDVLRTGLPTTVVLHDYYPYCLDLMKLFDNVSDLQWQLLRSTYGELVKQANIQMVAPCQSVKDQFLNLVDSTIDSKISIIAHGLPAQHIARLETVRENSYEVSPEKLKIVVLGSLVEIKGLKLFQESLSELLKIADIYLLGCGESASLFQPSKSLTIMPSYKAEELGDILKGIDPDIGMLMSIIEETFSYTLSELWAAGIPVLATKLGAYRDRIVVDKNGWLMDPSANSLLEHVQDLDENRDLITRAKQNLRLEKPKDCQTMAADYNSLPVQGLHISSRRYILAKKTHNNPYAIAHQQSGDSALYIDQQSSYRSVLLDFLLYSRAKINSTTQLGSVSKKVLVKLHSMLIKFVRP